MKVLIIDDAEEIRRIARFSLATLGNMEVSEADCGKDGLARAQAEQPDLILLDVMMPLMDGLSTLQALRSNDATSHIPVVFLTATDVPADEERLRSLGAAAVLAKPFDPFALPAQLREVMDQH